MRSSAANVARAAPQALPADGASVAGIPRSRPAAASTGYRSSQKGFTLLEVLVAFVVFVFIFSAVLDALGLALRNTRRSAEVSEAALWAQTKLDALGTIEELEEGSDSGEFNERYRWELEISRADVPREGGLSADTFPVDLYRIELIISWGERGRRNQQTFVTMRSKLKEGQF